MKLKVKIHCYNRSVLCGCETSFLTLKKEHRSKVSESRVLRRIFGLKTWGRQRKLHNEEFHNVCTSLNIILLE
jgi:hypothetical protein